MPASTNPLDCPKFFPLFRCTLDFAGWADRILRDAGEANIDPRRRPAGMTVGRKIGMRDEEEREARGNGDEAPRIGECTHFGLMALS